jgi:hypothetical protein
MKKVSILAVILALAAVSPVNVIIIIGGKTGMFGIVRRQTARLNVVNVLMQPRHPNLPPIRACWSLFFWTAMGICL